MSQAIELSLNPLLAARGEVLPWAKHVFGQLREAGDAGAGRASTSLLRRSSKCGFYLFVPFLNP